MRRVLPMLITLTALGNAQDAGDALRPFLQQNGPGARAMALGGAFTAVAEDYTAVYWNPAGLAQIRKMELLGGLSHISVANRIGYQGNVTRQTNGFTNIDAIGWVIPVPTVRGSLVFAIGYSRIRSFDDYNRLSGSPTVTGGNFFQDEETTSNGGLSQWSFSGAVDATKHVSLGATVNLVTGGQKASVRYFEDDSDDDVILDLHQRAVSLDIDPDYSGINLKLGAMFRLQPSTRLAVTVTTPTSLSVDERSGYSEMYDFDDDRATEFTGADYSLKYHISSPWRFEIAASHKLRNLLISGAVEVVDWTQTRFHSRILDEDLNDIDGEINSTILSSYRQTTVVKLGAEYLVPSLGLKLASGYRHEPSPFKSGVELVNSNRQILSAGLSFLLDAQVKLDVGYALAWWKQSTTDNLLGFDEIGNPLSTRENTKNHRFMVTFGYRF